MNKILILWLVILFGCKTELKRDSNVIKQSNLKLDSTLRAELLNMQEVDQKAAFPPEIRPLTDSIIGVWEKFKDSVYKTHQKRLKSILVSNGYPGIDFVGKEGAYAFWLMTQHCDFNIEFQQQVLNSMKIEVKKSNADPRNYAYLQDRVLLNQGKLQLYGTQVEYNYEGQAVSRPTEDELNVNNRRAEYGLEPLEVYLNSMTIMHFEMNEDNMTKRGVNAPILYDVNPKDKQKK